jgi:hypothetical protein
MSHSGKSSNPLKRIASSLKKLHERHKERHRPTGMGFAFADRIDYFDGRRWDELTRDASVLLRRDVLRVIEDHGPENVCPRYAMIFRDDQPVAAVAAQVVSVAGEQMGVGGPRAKEKDSSLLRRALSPAAKVAGKNLRERLLVAGNLLSWGFHGIAFAPGEDHAALWPSVAEALYRMRRAERLNGQTDLVMVKDLTDGQTGLETLRRFSYRPLETEPNMVLQIDPAWKNYDDYLTALNAKDQLKKLAGAGCSIEPLSAMEAHAPRLHELYLAVHANAPVRLVTLPPTYIPALATALGDDFRCTVVRRNEEILGFVTSVRDGETAIAYYIGFDRAAASEGLPIYLRLLHSTIGDAIAWRCKRLSLGRTALEPKAALGAKPEPMSVWLRHRLPAMNWMLRGVLGGVPHNEAPERNPFKSADGK